MSSSILIRWDKQEHKARKQIKMFIAKTQKIYGYQNQKKWMDPKRDALGFIQN